MKLKIGNKERKLKEKPWKDQQYKCILSQATQEKKSEKQTANY